MRDLHDQPQGTASAALSVGRATFSTPCGCPSQSDLSLVYAVVFGWVWRRCEACFRADSDDLFLPGEKHRAIEVPGESHVFRIMRRIRRSLRPIRLVQPREDGLGSPATHRARITVEHPRCIEPWATSIIYTGKELRWLACSKHDFGFPFAIAPGLLDGPRRRYCLDNLSICADGGRNWSRYLCQQEPDQNCHFFAAIRVAQIASICFCPASALLTAPVRDKPRRWTSVPPIRLWLVT